MPFHLQSGVAARVSSRRALNSAATERHPAGEALGRVAAPPARTRSPAMPFDSWSITRQATEQWRSGFGEGQASTMPIGYELVSVQRDRCRINHLGRLLVLHGHQQDSTEMPEEIGAGDAEFLLREIPRQLREWRREHQRRDAAPGRSRPSVGGAVPGRA